MVSVDILSPEALLAPKACTAKALKTVRPDSMGKAIGEEERLTRYPTKQK